MRRALLNTLLASLVHSASSTPLNAESRSSAEGLVGSVLATAKLTTSGSCCAALDYFLPGKVFSPASASYIASELSYFSQQEQQIAPSCIVIPNDSADVSTAVSVLNAAAQLSMANCNFAVRGAGHTPNPAAANIQGGVTINLQNLNEVTVSADRSFVSIGSGNRWGNVYTQLDAMNLTVAGGRVSTVGAGGLTTGGGISFFSGRYGMTCDNILNFQVVLSSGSIVNANATSNPALFRALKGGSNNLGIVTRFDFRSIEAGPFWGGFLVQDISQRPAIFKFFEKFARSATYDPYAAFINNYAWVSGAWIIESNVEYTQPEPYPPVWRPLFALPQLENTMRIAHHASFTTEIAASAALASTAARALFATLTVRNSAAFMEDFFQLANATVSSLAPAVSGLRFTVSYQPFPQQYFRNADNVLGLGPQDGDLVNILVGPYWSLAADDAKVYSAIQQLLDSAEAKAKSMGLANRYVYLNYAAFWQKPISGYGAANKAFLEAVSREYDPRQLFQRQCPGGFKLASS